MKTFLLITLLVVSSFVTKAADTFPLSRTNQPAIGTNVISYLTASNLFIYNQFVTTNTLNLFNGSLFNWFFSPTNRFSGTQVFEGTNVNNAVTFHNTNETFLAPVTISYLNLVVTDAVNMTFTYTNTFLTNGVLAGRTNTMYFTNGLLVRVTTP